jgi:hypothetical protein
MNENYNGAGFAPGNRFRDTIDSRNKRPFRGWATDEDFIRGRLGKSVPGQPPTPLFESFARTRSSLKVKTVEETKNGTNFGGSENGA